MLMLRPLCAAALVLGLGLPAALDDDKDKAPDLAGTWTWEWKDGQGETHRHVLEVEGKGSTLSARERFDDQEAVKVSDLKQDGKKVTFSVLRGDRRASYSGTVETADTINGKVTVSTEGGQPNEYGWTARREPTKPK
jgi:hypothetical protein